MKPHQLLAIALFAAAVARCGDGDRPVEPTTDQEPEVSDLQRTLSANRQRFHDHVGSSYSYEYQNVCFCVDDYRRNVRITVRDGARFSVHGVDDGMAIPTEKWDQFLSIEAIFDAIQKAIDEGAASVRAEFDDALGYPRDVYIDVDERIADEERGYTVRNLKVDP